jgi:hypothetical protein
MRVGHPPPKPILKWGDRRRRLKFVEREEGRSWDDCWYADEKRYQVRGRPNGRNEIVWLDPGEKVKPYQTEKHTPTVKVWAAFSRAGHTALCIYNSPLNADRYINIMDHYLLPAFIRVQGDRPVTYIHDGDGVHRAKKVVVWLESNVHELIGNPEWPPRSPDLNPMENVWSLLAKEVRKSQPTTAGQLRAALRRGWDTVMPDELRASMIDSMPRRLAAVKRARGGHTKY